jgi:hypothetical protein
MRPYTKLNATRDVSIPFPKYLASSTRRFWATFLVLQNESKYKNKFNRFEATKLKYPV